MAPPTPILWLSSGFLLGQITTAWTTSLAWTAAIATAALVALAQARRRGGTPLLALAVCAAAVGHLQLAERLQPNLPDHHIANNAAPRLHVRGRITDQPRRRASGVRFTLEVGAVRNGPIWQPAQGSLLVTVRSPSQAWAEGDLLDAEIRLRHPRNFGNPGEFDYQRYLARRRIYVTAFAFSDEHWQLQARSSRGWHQRTRSRAADALDQLATTRVRSIAGALLLGDSPSVPDTVRRDYAAAGVAHLLAISGLHVGLIAGGAYLAMRWLLSRSEYLLLRCNVPKLATAACLPPLLAYTAIAGGSPATIRAMVMTTLVLAGMVLDRSRSWHAPLAAAAAAICALHPGAASEASFQLSFAAVTAILAGSRPILARYDAWSDRRFFSLRAPRLHRIGRAVVASQAVSALALAATAPLTLYHFQQLSLVGLIANPLVIPISGMGGVGFGLAGVLLTAELPGAGAILLGIACDLLALGDSMVTHLATLPGADLRLPTPSASEIATFYAAAATPLLPAGRLRRAWLVLALLTATVQGAYWIEQRSGGDTLRITFISVGQGDCTLLEMPDGRVMLVDGGGLSSTFDVGERIVTPLLRRRKISRVDTLVLTHPDFDHYGGLATIAEQFGARELWTSGARKSGVRFSDFEHRINAAGTRRLVIGRGSRRRFGDATVDVLHPPSTLVDPSNDSSLVLRIRYGAASILLAGDLEAAGERLLTQTDTDLRADVLKVPHHGSKTSSTHQLLAAVQPRLAVASVGFANRYGMPHQAVSRRYAQHHIDLLRTDRDGAIEIHISAGGSIAYRSGRHHRKVVYLTANLSQPECPSDATAPFSRPSWPPLRDVGSSASSPCA